MLLRLSLIVLLEFSFVFVSFGRSCRIATRGNLQMKWQFAKGGSMQELGLIGSEGEFYYDPNKPGLLKGHAASQGKKLVVPIFPYNNALLPLSTDWLNIFEMKHRQLINDIGDGYFGFSYFSQQNRKLSLVGTLAKIKERKLLNDGRTFVIVEGVKRFYLTDFVSEKPYVKARVHTFADVSERPDLLDDLEQKIFLEVRMNIKLMEKLYPTKNYTIGANILRYRPQLRYPQVRLVNLAGDASEMQRRSDFSFSVMDMLQISPQTKLALLQDHVIESRLEKILQILVRGGAFLRSEALDKRVLTNDEILQLQNEIDTSFADVEDIFPPQSWSPENYVNGKWVQSAVMM